MVSPITLANGILSTLLLSFYENYWIQYHVMTFWFFVSIFFVRLCCWTVCMFYIVGSHSFTLSGIFLHKCLTDSDSIDCLWIIISSLTKNLLSLPAVLSLSVVHHIIVMFCDFLMFMLSVSGYGSLCLRGRLNVRVLVKPVPALLWGCTASVSHVLSHLSSAYMLFLVCCASTPPALCCLHAKLWETFMCFPGIISLLSS